MQNFLLTLAYDGTNYCGFQVQPNGRSVAQTFQDALQAVLGSRPDIKGCSRTDAGVHALASSSTSTPTPASRRQSSRWRSTNICRRTSGCWTRRWCRKTSTPGTRPIPKPISTASTTTPSTRLLTRLITPGCPGIWTKPECRRRRSSSCRHDFLALCAAGSSAAAHGDTVRTITDCHVTRKGDEIDIEVTADGYLYNMVRILAGTLCEAGAGRLDPAEIPAILESRDRSRAGPDPARQGPVFEVCGV